MSQRLDALDLEIATTIVSVEEQTRGWLAVIARSRGRARLIEAYARLENHLMVIADWRVLGFDEASADGFDHLRKNGIRIGTMDLRIASIVLASRATLLTRNTKDFEQVPGLKFENWL